MLPVPRGSGQPGGDDRDPARNDPARNNGGSDRATDQLRGWWVPVGRAPSGRPALLIADDEVDDAMLGSFAAGGVEVSVVADGAQALLEIGLQQPAALLISARLPVVDGVTVVRTVRSVAGHDNVPILLAVGPDDRPRAAAGLDAGASACVSKPYRVPEVLAMVGAIGTTWAGAYQPAAAGSEVLRGGPVLLDRAAHEVRLDGAVVPVPPREFRLLALLLEQAGRVVPRETLLREVWGSAQTETNTLAVHVRRLRRRLGESAGQPTVIESIRGVGYRFRAAPEPS